jgi:hypothetical protein
MQRRGNLLVLSVAGLVTLGAVANACSASNSQFDKKKHSTSGPGTGGSGGLDLMTGSGGTGNAPACTDPTCIGNTPQGNCDSGLAIDSADAMDGARAIGLCQVAQTGTWGVTDAQWVRSDGQPLVGGGDVDGITLDFGKGILTHFGNVIMPREGSSLLAISSGVARNPSDPGFADPGGAWKDGTPHGSPPGYPKESPSCPGVVTGEPYDSAGLRVTIRTPTDAKSFAFDFDFYTYEYPDFICSQFNDFFVAMLTPVPQGLTDGNISFDDQGNNISVNAGFLQACNACNAGGKNFACALGYGEIAGTGFESNTAFTCPIQGSASTSWLVTTAPVEDPGGDITLHFAVWDSGDGVLDSTTLIDNFRFELGDGEVGTKPIPK